MRFFVFLSVGMLLNHEKMRKSLAAFGGRSSRCSGFLFSDCDLACWMELPPPPPPSHRWWMFQEEHGIGDRLLHNIAQEATWDASARYVNPTFAWKQGEQRCFV